MIRNQPEEMFVLIEPWAEACGKFEKA